jgi:hypothetical protein
MRRRRRLWIILVATPFVLAAADTLYWYLAQRNLDAGFTAWVAERRAEGWTATTHKPKRGGWPLAATLTVPQALLKGGDAYLPGGLIWNADQLVLRVALWRPGRLEIAVAGAQHLRLANGPVFPMTAERLHIVVPLQADAPSYAVEVSAHALRVGLPLGGDTPADATVGLLRSHVEFQPTAQSGEPAVSVSLHVEEIGLPSAVAHPLGQRIGNLTIVGALDGPVPQAKGLAERAGAWREAGGTLEVQHLAVNWGPLDLTASATLSLDEQLQPMGAGNVRAVGYAETLDALAAHSAISKSAATAAKAVLSLLAHSPEDGSPPDVEVPLTLQYRTLSMRQVPLVRLPELDWP